MTPQGLQPPERFMTNGAVGPYQLFPQLLDDLDLLREVEVCKVLHRIRVNHSINRQRHLLILMS